MKISLRTRLRYRGKFPAGFGRTGLVCLGALLSACAEKTTGVAEYSRDDCRRVALIDAATGRSIVGAEDLAIAASSGQLIVSAYDRRAVESAVRRKAFDVPEGGLYAVALADLSSLADGAAARPLIAAAATPGGLRPHGLTLDPDRGEILFINRTYQKIDGHWILQSTIERADVTTTDFGRPVREGNTTCSANSVTLWHDKLLQSFDRPVCGWRAVLHDAGASQRTGIMDVQGHTMLANAKFANGLVALPSGDVALADTRAGAVLIARDDGAGGLREVDRIPVPGGPDNLRLSEDGAILAAVHPSMFRMALHRIANIGRAPSRIVRVSPESGSVTLLFDDRSGALFSAATSAVSYRGSLIAGSVLDAGLLVCQSPELQRPAGPSSPL